MGSGKHNYPALRRPTCKLQPSRCIEHSFKSSSKAVLLHPTTITATPAITPPPSKSTMEEDGPQIIRPVPRRPFDLSFINPTPPDDDASGTIPHHELLASRLLRLVDEPPSDISSPPSYMNLTSSTLAGIYSPGPSDGGDDDEDTAPYFKEEDEVVITPIEPRARTPLDSPDSEDEGLHMRRHTHTIRRDSIYSNNSVETNSGVSPTVSLILRAGVLFTLGTGFGVIITRYHTEGRFTSLADVATAASLDWKYWVFWGVAAVLLGTSLPLFDRYWEETHPPQTHAKPVLKPVEDEPTSESLDAGMDWALVVRAIGAFVGIAFAVVSTHTMLRVMSGG